MAILVPRLDLFMFFIDREGSIVRDLKSFMRKENKEGRNEKGETDVERATPFLIASLLDTEVPELYREPVICADGCESCRSTVLWESHTSRKQEVE